MILNARLKELPDERKARLLNYLSNDEISILKENDSGIRGLDVKKFSTDFVLKEVHYSWFLPTLKAYSDEETSLFLNALEKETAENLKRKLHIDSVHEDIKTPTKTFLRLILQVSLLGEEDCILPPEYLPSSPLNRLIKIEKRSLVEIIDYLALYDLAREVRQTVDTKILKQIYHYLSEPHKVFLKKIMNRKDTGGFQKIGLANWDGSPGSLKNLLHKRGIRRLALALKCAHPDLTWYVSHRLDIGRGGTLLKVSDKKVMADVVDIMIESVDEALKEISE